MSFLYGGQGEQSGDLECLGVGGLNEDRSPIKQTGGNQMMSTLGISEKASV